MKKAFTMIELIFIIVIIGILAAIAIPRLTATRDDAVIVSEIDSAVQVLHNLGAEYASQGDLVNYTIAMANAETNCFTFAELADGNISVVLIATTACGTAIVTDALKLKAEENGLTAVAGASKTHVFGGSNVKF